MAHIETEHGNAPLQSHVWGWREVGEELRPQGPCIGYVRYDDTVVYLHPEKAYEVAAKFAQGLGEPLGVSERTMRAHLWENGYLAERGKDKATYSVRTTLGGIRQSVLALKGEVFLDVDDQDEADTPPVL